MNRRLEIIIVALGVAVMGAGITSSLADEAGVEARVGELRGAVLSLFAPAVPSRRKRTQITKALRRPRLRLLLRRPPRTGRATTKR